MYRGAVVVLVLLESSTAFLTRGHTIAKAARPGRALAAACLESGGDGDAGTRAERNGDVGEAEAR